MSRSEAIFGLEAIADGLACVRGYADHVAFSRAIDCVFHVSGAVNYEQLAANAFARFLMVEHSSSPKGASGRADFPHPALFHSLSALKRTCLAKGFSPVPSELGWRWLLKRSRQDIAPRSR